MKKTIKITLIFLILIFYGWKYYPFLSNFLKRKSLIRAYNKIISSEIVKAKNISLPVEKSQIVLNEFENKTLEPIEPLMTSSKTLNTKVSGNNGVIRAKTQYFFNDQCSNKKIREITGNIWFEYKNNNWVMDTYHKQCTRSEPYNMPDEFNRAINLIIQRFKGSIREEDQEFGNNFSEIINCLDIQYAKTDLEMSSAEGLFLFKDDSPRDHLAVLISPQYKYNDDLTTSLILVHELYHALLRFRSEDILYSYYDNETYANTISYTYYFLLTPDEQNYLLSKYVPGNSDEIAKYIDTNKKILNLPGNDLAKKFKDYVENNQIYMNNCDNQ